MTKSKLLSVFALLALLPAFSLSAQKICGNGLRNEKLAKEQPAEFQRLLNERDTKFELARKSASAASKTTAQYAIPVVFHFILTPAQHNYVGGDTGIIRRVKSQLAGLNRDFNRHNKDSISIPTPFKPVYTSMGIEFGLANSSSANTISPGIEVKVLAAGSIPDFDANVDCYKAKHSSSNGLDSWDETKYFNVWVGNLTAGGSFTIVGLTSPPSSIGTNAGGHVITDDEIGMVLNYGSIGVREFPAQNFIAGTDLGRTMTHEMGHYFELWHIWGDDGGLCPTNGGNDDGISDTPPEADAQYCNSGVCPTYPKTDACSNVSPGIMFMNFMDYVDDKAMVMFTAEQGTVARFYLQSESYSLTQHPELVKVSDRVLPDNTLRISPNPAGDFLRIENTGAQHLQEVELINALGQTVYRTKVNGNQPLTIHREAWMPGVYYIHCQFAEGRLSKKIVFE